MDREDATVGGAVNQLVAAVAVDVARDHDGPIVGQEQRPVAALEHPRLHHHGRALAAEVPVDAHRPLVVSDHQLDAPAPAPGKGQRRRVNPQIDETNIKADLGLQRERGVPGAPDIPQPEHAAERRPAAPEAALVVTGMAPLLVETNPLRLGDNIGDRPVTVPVIDPREQVGQAVAVPVNRHDLHDPARPDPQIGRDSQRLPRPERRPVGLALVAEQDQAGSFERHEVKAAGRAVRDGAKAAQAVEPLDGGPGVVSQRLTRWAKDAGRPALFPASQRPTSKSRAPAPNQSQTTGSASHPQARGIAPTLGSQPKRGS